MNGWDWRTYVRLLEILITCAALIGLGIYTYVNPSCMFYCIMATFFGVSHGFRLWRVFPSEHRHAFVEATKRADALLSKIVKTLPVTPLDPAEETVGLVLPAAPLLPCEEASVVDAEVEVEEGGGSMLHPAEPGEASPAAFRTESLGGPQ